MGVTHMHSKSGMHSFPNCVCGCEEICGSQTGDHSSGNLRTFFGLTDMIESILCPKQDGAQ